MPIPDVGFDSHEEWQRYERMVEFVNQILNTEQRIALFPKQEVSLKDR
jgi:hypothetical protein